MNSAEQNCCANGKFENVFPFEVVEYLSVCFDTSRWAGGIFKRLSSTNFAVRGLPHLLNCRFVVFFFLFVDNLVLVSCFIVSHIGSIVSFPVSSSLLLVLSYNKKSRG